MLSIEEEIEIILDTLIDIRKKELGYEDTSSNIIRDVIVIWLLKKKKQNNSY